MTWQSLEQTTEVIWEESLRLSGCSHAFYWGTKSCSSRFFEMIWQGHLEPYGVHFLSNRGHCLNHCVPEACSKCCCDPSYMQYSWGLCQEPSLSLRGWAPMLATQTAFCQKQCREQREDTHKNINFLSSIFPPRFSFGMSTHPSVICKNAVGLCPRAASCCSSLHFGMTFQCFANSPFTRLNPYTGKS